MCPSRFATYLISEQDLPNWTKPDLTLRPIWNFSCPIAISKSDRMQSYGIYKLMNNNF